MTTTPISKKILVVDDDKAVTTLLEGFTFEPWLPYVLVAHDGLDGMVQVGKILRI